MQQNGITPFTIGSVVSLKSHPFAFSLNFENILIGGDGDAIPPLMVIGEALRNSETSHDVNTGDQITNKEDFSYRCYWYSLKGREFKDTWIKGYFLEMVFSATELEQIDFSDKNLERIRIGSIVNFNSNLFELRKIKCTNKFDIDFSSKNPQLTSLISYIAPTMAVIGFVKTEEKELPFDPKKGYRKRFKPYIFVKCRYFNPEQNKFPEVVLPIESLSLIKPSEKNQLDKVNTVINQECFLRIVKDEKFDLIIPKKVAFVGGYWFVFGTSVKSGEIVSFEIGITEFEVLVKPIIKKLPKIDNSGNETKQTEISVENFQMGIGNWGINKFLVLTYRNSIGKISKRILTDYRVEKGKEKTKDSNATPSWLHGFCNLKREERSFLFGSIIELKLLDFSAARGSNLLRSSPRVDNPVNVES